MIRLLDPDKYKGTLHFTIDVTGSTIYVNGSKTPPDGKGNLALTSARRRCASRIPSIRTSSASST